MSPASCLTVARDGRSDHTVVLHPASTGRPEPTTPAVAAGAASPLRAPRPQPAANDRAARRARGRSNAIGDPDPRSTTRPKPERSAAGGPETEAAGTPEAPVAKRPSRPPPPNPPRPPPPCLRSTPCNGHRLGRHGSGVAPSCCCRQGWTLAAEVLLDASGGRGVCERGAPGPPAPDGGHEVTWLPDGGFTDAVDPGRGQGLRRGRRRQSPSSRAIDRGRRLCDPGGAAAFPARSLRRSRCWPRSGIARVWPTRGSVTTKPF